MPRRALTLFSLILVGLLGPVAPAVAAPTAQSERDDDDLLFGVNFVPPEEPLMSMAWDAGARVARIQINWQDIERQPGNYGWDYVDSLVNPLIARGFSVHAVLTLPPDFRRADGGYMPANINHPWDHPDNQWARWVGAVAEHYRGRIDSYEVWNEPDLDLYWNGTPGQYFQLLRTAYPAIKEADPDATVVMAGMAIFTNREFLPDVMSAIATHPSSPDNNYYFDALSIHLYTDPDLMYHELTQVQALLARYDLEGKPIWLTETGVPLLDEGAPHAPPPATPGFGSEEEAGWFILQGFASALAAGVERIMVYRLQDTPQPVEPIRYGMLRSDLSTRPSYDAYRVAATYLSAGGDVTRRVAGGVTTVKFTRPDGGLLTVVWANNQDAGHYALPANHSRAIMVDWSGNSSRIEANDGVYNLNLGPATNALIGGPPVMIIEEDGVPPFVQVARLPDYLSAGTELTLTWTADDGESGTGVTGFDVQISHNDGPWIAWLTNTQATEGTYDVSAGGNFKFRVRALDGAGNLSEFVLANRLGTRVPGVPLGQNLGANFTSVPDVDGEGDPYFGVNFVPPEQPWMDLAWDAGVRTARIQINWQDIERTPGIRDWTYVDGLVLPLAERGFEVTAILTLPPEFRRANPDEGFMPADLYLLWDDPDNLWGDWVHRVATHFEGQISAYEIWNEPDLDIYWDGTAADYGELLRSAYQAIKHADPDATVVMGGMALREDLDFLSEVVDYIYNDEQGPPNEYFFDAAAIHVYSETELLYDEINEARELLESYGIEDKEIWVTETNVPLWGEASGPEQWESGYANPEEAAWFIVQAFATAHAAGAERVMVYRLHDVGEPIAHGLLRNDQSERPAYVAYKVGATFFSDVVSGEREQTQEATIIRLTKENGGRVTVVWANTGFAPTITLDAIAPAGLFANADGSVWPANPRDDGTYTLDLDPATNRDLSRDDTFFFGGTPIILVEDDREPPRVSFEPLTAVATDSTLALQWAADDGTLGTGVASFDVQVKEDDGDWEDWLEDYTDTEAVYNAEGAATLEFRIRARDRVGNESRWVENPTGQVFVNGVLLAEVLNVRGEPVPDAEISLPNRRTYATDESGVARITDLDLGENTIVSVDGGNQGVLFPAPVVIDIGEETQVIWVLQPKRNHVPNGDFSSGMVGWNFTTTIEDDIAVIDVDGDRFAQLSGPRRPWGPPSISIGFRVPARLDDPVFSFRYRLPTEGRTLLLTTLAAGERGEPSVLSQAWQSEGPTEDWERVWLDATPYVGKSVEFIFTLQGSKKAPSGLAQIDEVALGELPEP